MIKIRKDNRSENNTTRKDGSNRNLFEIIVAVLELMTLKYD